MTFSSSSSCFWTCSWKRTSFSQITAWSFSSWGWEDKRWEVRLSASIIRKLTRIQVTCSACATSFSSSSFWVWRSCSCSSLLLTSSSLSLFFSSWSSSSLPAVNELSGLCCRTIRAQWLLKEFSHCYISASLPLTVASPCPLSSLICLLSEAILALACSLSLVKRASSSSFSLCVNRPQQHDRESSSVAN